MRLTRVSTAAAHRGREILYKPQIMVKTQMRLLRGQPGPEKPQESYWNCSPRCYSPGGRRSCFDTFFYRAAGANYLVTGLLYFTAVEFVIFCVDYYYYYSCGILLLAQARPRMPCIYTSYISQRYVIHVLATKCGPFSYFDRGAIHPRTQSHKYEPPPSAT